MASTRPATTTGLYNQDAGRWLWFSGFSEPSAAAGRVDISSNPSPPAMDIEGLIEAQRARCPGSPEVSKSSVSVTRHTGGSWVHFESPAFAQHCMSSLNGFSPSATAPMLRVRYGGDNEDTSRAPQVRYVKRLRSETAAPAAPVAAATNGTTDAKRIKIETTNAPPSKALGGRSSPSLNASLTPTTAAPNGGAAAKAPVKNWAGGPGTTADVLRVALSKLDVDVALSEIVHFLTHDERLPSRTRKAVQFLHGLREQMVQGEAHKSKPELFDCPFASKSIIDYTFKEIRMRYGDSFPDTFWPVFQAFNCMLPAPDPQSF